MLVRIVSFITKNICFLWRQAKLQSRPFSTKVGRDYITSATIFAYFFCLLWKFMWSARELNWHYLHIGAKNWQLTSLKIIINTEIFAKSTGWLYSQVARRAVRSCTHACTTSTVPTHLTFMKNIIRRASTSYLLRAYPRSKFPNHSRFVNGFSLGKQLVL